MPTTPKRQRVEEPSSLERPRSSGSPLKLFDKYDTFTNERLTRRISKFEETVPNSEKSSEEQSLPRKGHSSRISSFGEGELNNHPFSPHQPYHLHQFSGQDKASQRKERGSGDFHFEHISEQRSSSVLRRKRKGYTTLSANTQTDISESEDREDYKSQVVHRTASPKSAAGKRLPYSPAKAPEPKRRRTLLEAELRLDAVIPPQGPEKVEDPPKSAVGRKRKDARYESSTQVANPEVLASRQILRPRNPTPSQSGARGFNVKSPNTWDYRPRTDEQPHEGPETIVDAPTARLAEELASLALNVAQNVTDDVRKPSVTTADFFNEAQQIMQLIRSKGLPSNSRISEEEPVTNQYEDFYDSQLLDSTRDESRGRPVVKAAPYEENANQCS